MFDVIDHGVVPAVHVGCMTAGRAAAKFGIDALFMSASHGFCQDCLDRLESLDAETPANSADDLRSSGFLGLVGLLRRPATIETLRRLTPGLPVLNERLARLVDAGFVAESSNRGRRLFVATARGQRACEAIDRRRITAVRRRFRGKKEM